MDEDYLRSLVICRDDAENMESPLYMRGYFQGRIEEYCAQNAIVQLMVPDIDLGIEDE